MNIKIINHSIKIVVLIFILILLFFNIKNCKKQDNYLKNINSLNEELIKYENRDGVQVSKIKIIEFENSKQFLEIKSKDEKIIQLQELVKKNNKKIKEPGSSITIIKNTTDINSRDKTIINFRDTININDTIYIYPEYNSLIRKGLIKNSDSLYWISGSVLANKDSITLDVLVHNSYSLILGREKEKGFKNLFKKKIPFAEITNENPYTDTKTLRTYQVQEPRPKRLGIGFHVGYGLVLDKQPIFRPYIGIGLQYNIIQIK